MAISLCSTVGANTGQIDCDVTRGNPQSILVGSGSIAAADYATEALFKIAFAGKLKLAAGDSEKLFPFPIIQTTVDKSDPAKEATLGYGLKVKLLRSRAGYEFDVLAGSSLEKKLIKFDGKIIPLFIFDDQANVWGIKAANGNFAGAKYLVGVEPRGFGDAQNAKTTKITISIIDSRDFTENAYFYSTDFSVNDLTGLLDADITEISHSTNAYKLKVTVATSQIGVPVNLYTQYQDLLASTSLWIAKTGATYGTSLALTTVVKDAVNAGWTVTFDNTAFGALASGAKIKVSLADPATLNAADVTDIESVALIITKP